jgi:hypothetical protein
LDPAFRDEGLEELEEEDEPDPVPPPSDGTLFVEVKSCEDILPADKNGKSDPFVILRLGDGKRQTKHVMKTLNPVFNQTKQLPVNAAAAAEPGGMSLSVEVWDWDRGQSNDFLGELSIDLTQAFSSDGWIGTVVPGQYVFGDPNRRLGGEESKHMTTRRVAGNAKPYGSVDLTLRFKPASGGVEEENLASPKEQEEPVPEATPSAQAQLQEVETPNSPEEGQGDTPRSPAAEEEASTQKSKQKRDSVVLTSPVKYKVLASSTVRSGPDATSPPAPRGIAAARGASGAAAPPSRLAHAAPRPAWPRGRLR